MNRLLQIEFIKVKSYRAFWAVLGIYALTFIVVTSTIGVIESSARVSASAFFSFPDAWHHLASVASFLNILPAILIIMLISNEYSFRTFRQNLIDGLSREELVYSKFILIGAIALLCIAFIFVYGFTRGLIAGHFDELGEMVEKISFLFRLFVQMAGYMSLAALFTFILKRSAISILVFLVYVGFELSVRQFMPIGEIRRFFPVSIFSALIPAPGDISLVAAASLSPDLILALSVLYISACIGACYVLINKSNL